MDIVSDFNRDDGITELGVIGLVFFFRIWKLLFFIL